MIEKKIAERIRKFRKAKGLTLAQLGEAVNLSPGLLSRIENNQSSPPIATLAKIAQGLEVPIGVFFEDWGDRPKRIAVTREEELQQVVQRASEIGFVYYAFKGMQIPHRVEAFIMKHPPGKKSRRDDLYFDHLGEEFIYVLSGELEFVYGERVIQLAAGDAVHFDPAEPHRVQNPGESKSECLVIIVGEQIVT